MANRISPISFADAALNWLNAKSLSDSAVVAYRGEVLRLSQFCAKRGLDDLNQVQPTHWVAYIRSLSKGRRLVGQRKPPLKPGSVLQAIRITRAYLAHAAKRGWITWQPWDVDLPVLPPTESADSGREALSPSVRQALRGEVQAANEEEARRVFVLALSFWGALLPKDLCALKVRELRVLETQPGATLTCQSRESPIALPQPVALMWQQYVAYRREGSTTVKPSSPLIASLRGNVGLTPWAIWSILRKETSLDQSVAPRTLRASYVALAAQQAEQDISVVLRQAGKQAAAKGLAERDSASRIEALNSQALQLLGASKAKRLEHPTRREH